MKWLKWGLAILKGGLWKYALAIVLSIGLWQGVSGAWSAWTANLIAISDLKKANSNLHNSFLQAEQERDEAEAALMREAALSKKYYREAVRLDNKLDAATTRNNELLESNTTLRDWYNDAIPPNELY